MESSYDEAFTALIATEHTLEDKEKALAACEQDISSLCRRLTLLEQENWTAETRLGKMTIDLANVCESMTFTLDSCRSSTSCSFQAVRPTTFNEGRGNWSLAA